MIKNIKCDGIKLKILRSETLCLLSSVAHRYLTASYLISFTLVLVTDKPGQKKTTPFRGFVYSTLGLMKLHLNVESAHARVTNTNRVAVSSQMYRPG